MAGSVTERPFPCQAHEVRAILEDRKTQTRRPVKLPDDPEEHGFDCCPLKGFPGIFTFWDAEHPEEGGWNVKCPYGQPGDRLWVREAWAIKLCYQCDRGYEDEECTCPDPPIYRATDPDWPLAKDEAWRPSTNMPRKASRIDLEITKVSVGRVRDISLPDIRSEGVDSNAIKKGFTPVEAKIAFADLWDPIYAKRGFGWDVNPWVWILEFKRRE